MSAKELRDSGGGERETLSQRIARGYKEEDDKAAGRWGSREEGLQALKEGHWQWAPWLQRSCVWPDERLLDLIVSSLIASGCHGITSLGCGNGLLEWFLAEKLEPMSIRGFDLRPLELQLLPEAARAISYGQLISSDIVVHVPEDDALLISWGELSVWKIYLETYQTRGKCLILIVDEQDVKCNPNIRDMTEFLKIGEPASCWSVLVDQFIFENKLGPYSCTEKCKISIYVRNLSP